MQIHALSLSRGTTTGGRPPPPWVRVRSSAVGLVAEFLPSRHGLGQIVLRGQALVQGEVTVNLRGHGTIVVPMIAGDTAADVALELSSRILVETGFDATLRARGEGFSVALGKKVEVV